MYGRAILAVVKDYRARESGSPLKGKNADLLTSKRAKRKEEGDSTTPHALYYQRTYPRVHISATCVYR